MSRLGTVFSPALLIAIALPACFDESPAGGLDDGSSGAGTTATSPGTTTFDPDPTGGATSGTRGPVATSGPSATGDPGRSSTTGEETAESSSSGAEPCADGCDPDTPVCDPDANDGAGACVVCLVDEDCNDAFACSLDSCVEGACEFVYDDSPGCEPAWTELGLVTSPGSRAWADMAFDVARGQAVMFGGFIDGVTNDETWLWDGTSWTLAEPDNAPSPRFTHGMVYDAAREVVVLYGGLPAQFSTDTLVDTWEWDGENWTEVRTIAAPTPRTPHHNLAYDPISEQVLLFGRGTQPSQPVFEDLWAYDGATWTMVDGGSGPEARIASCVEWMDGVGGMVVAGGGDWGPYYNDTWVWDGAWSELQSTGSWSSRQSALCAYDSFRDRMVMHAGGQNIDFANDTWEFDGTNWEQHAGLDPGPTCCSAMTYDPARREVVSHIGGATWVYGP